jgi:hypothetical protein
MFDGDEVGLELGVAEGLFDGASLGISVYNKSYSMDPLNTRGAKTSATSPENALVTPAPS